VSKGSEVSFVNTKEYRRFLEFCDACRRYRYIGLCYGRPGVGKSLSAREYTKWDKVAAYMPHSTRNTSQFEEVCGIEVVLYTPQVSTSPREVDREVGKLRQKLRDLSIERIHREEEPRIAAANRRLDRQYKLTASGQTMCNKYSNAYRRAEAAVLQAHQHASQRVLNVPDPTTLILVDEADRLKEAGLEQLRDIFDRSHLGMILIGMPGLEKRLVRYPQLYSRVGFVHEFRALPTAEVRKLLESNWHPPGIELPSAALSDEEGIAAILRITGGNFRTLDRLLAQIARVLEINKLDRVTCQVVEAARESLVIGAD
jgi:DNA transposition AAA+ family ATPase